MVIVHLFDKRYWDVWFAGTSYNTTPKKVAKVKTWCLDEKAELCYNLAYFNLADGVTVNYVKAKGSDVGYGGITDRLKVDDLNICGGYALGINKSEVVMGKGDGRLRTRNGMGYTPDYKIIIAQSTTGITERDFCEEVARQVKTYYKNKASIFFMEDGGASTSSYSSFSLLTLAPEGGRRVATTTCLKRKLPVKIGKTLSVGSKGEDVRYLQMLIGGLECDGSFGNATRARVKLVQKAHNLEPDGSVGPLTLKALGLA